MWAAGGPGEGFLNPPVGGNAGEFNVSAAAQQSDPGPCKGLPAPGQPAQPVSLPGEVEAVIYRPADGRVSCGNLW